MKDMLYLNEILRINLIQIILKDSARTVRLTRPASFCNNELFNVA